MLRKVCTVTLLASVCLIAALAFLSSSARADMGVFPMRPDVSVYEPGQKAIIAWNDGKEIMILSTDANASEATKALRVLPLPSMPEIQTGSFRSFEEVQRLINAHMPRQMSRPGWSALGVAPPAVEILFHERIGAHDITVAKANDYAGFLEWARDFVGEAGFSLPSRAEPVIEQYIEDNVRYFVFDIVEITEEERSIEPIVYEFETPVLYYPLVISTLIPGETKITLFIIQPSSLSYRPAPSPFRLAYYGRPWWTHPWTPDAPPPSLLPMFSISFSITPQELARIDPQIAKMFDSDRARLSVLEYKGPLRELTTDLRLSFIPFVPLQTSIWVDKGCDLSYAVGDRITVYFQVSRPARVTIYDYTTEGNTQVLSSKEFNPGTHTITGVVSGPPGEERLEIIAEANGERAEDSCTFYIGRFGPEDTTPVTLAVKAMARVQTGPVTLNTETNVPVQLNGVSRVTPFSESLAIGSLVTLVAPLDVHTLFGPVYFDGWLRNDTRFSGNTQIVVTLYEDTTFEAEYVPRD